MRVVIADDSALLREGVAKLLEDGGLEVVGRAVDGEDLLLKARSYKPDIARGSGLRGLADRLEAHGGRLRVESPVGGGTKVIGEVPCAS